MGLTCHRGTAVPFILSMLLPVETFLAFRRYFSQVAKRVVRWPSKAVEVTTQTSDGLGGPNNFGAV